MRPRRRLATLVAALAVALAAAPAPAAVTVPVPPRLLAERAPVVLIGTVDSVRDGRDADGAIATYVTLEVDRVLRGPALERVTLREPGGVFDGLGVAVDVAPLYAVGERVLVYLTAGRGGMLRTYQHLFGKLRLRRDAGAGVAAWRDLGAAGLLTDAGGGAERWERFPLAELVAQVRDADPGGVLPLGELRAEPGPEVELAPVGGADFTTIDPATRWFEPDSGVPLLVDVDPARNPLDDDAATVASMAVAMDAWTEVAEARLEIELGDPDSGFSQTHGSSPTNTFPSGFAHEGIILFGDPYDDIDPPVGCSGTLAIGGSWYFDGPGSAKLVNGQSFQMAALGFVIFNTGWDTPFCSFLDVPLNLEEVAAHELGHVIGFGHSTVTDALMRAQAYGGRGARLGADDADGVHCFYPHTLDVLVPDGGEVFEEDDPVDVTWSATFEPGDPGTVDLELSTDGGASWSPIATDVPNTGLYAWTVPSTPTTEGRVRVHRPLALPAPAPFPDSCTDVTSAGSFTIVDLPFPGEVPDGVRVPGTPLELVPIGVAVELTWGASCGDGAAYAVYEGTLASLQQGVFDHVSRDCNVTAEQLTITPLTGAAYFLVVPIDAGAEGLYGEGSDGAPRPVAASPCATQVTSGCPAP